MHGKSKFIEAAIKEYISDRSWIPIIEAATEGRELEMNVAANGEYWECFFQTEMSFADFLSTLNRIRIKPEAVCDECGGMGWIIDTNSSPNIYEATQEKCPKCGVNLEKELAPLPEPEPLPWRPVTEDERLCLPMDAAYICHKCYIPSKYRGYTAPAKSGLHFRRVEYFTRQHLPKPVKMIPLGPEDVPPGSVIRSIESKGESTWTMIHVVTEREVYAYGEWIGYFQLFQRYLINRNDNKGWVKAEKAEATK